MIGMEQIEIEHVKAEVMTIPDQAKLIVVRDQESMTKANGFFLVIKGLRKKIGETMDPIIKKAHETHKESLNQKAALEAPLIMAEKWINAQMTSYKLEQDRIREAEERKVREEAIRIETERRKLEEEQRMAEAAALEAAGKHEEAEQTMAEAIQAKEEPIIVQMPVTMPKVEIKGATLRQNWTFEITNESLIPRDYLIPDLVKIGGVVKALKGQTNIPGIRVYNDPRMASTGR